jgi:hypothetical protein
MRLLKAEGLVPLLGLGNLDAYYRGRGDGRYTYTAWIFSSFMPVSSLEQIHHCWPGVMNRGSTCLHDSTSSSKFHLEV